MAGSRAWRTAVGAAAACLVCAVSGSPADALTPSRLIVFGDSLSDIGNIDDATLGVVPGSSFYNGRFSNGPVWVERLASDLGLGPLAPSTAGGTNYAYGGAQTSGANGFGGLFIRDLDEQLADYLGSQTADPHALYVVWAGANDLFDGQTDVSVPVSRVVAHLETLAARGARQFVVPNLPILGRIPQYNRDPVASAAFDQLSYQYNALFEMAMDGLAARQPSATFYRLDVGELFSSAIANPGAYGLTNVVDPAAPGLTPGAFFYSRRRIVPNPQQYLFWDTIHPTAAVHQILGDAASRLVEGAPGDFDADGEVDAADLALLRAGMGATGATRRQGDADGDGDVDGADFVAWQRALGTNIAAAPSGQLATIVPEPGAAALLFTVVAVFVRGLMAGRSSSDRGT
ncbi:MAG TPA: SGNH/GDSL hydrolase family protein [Lacipirellulaceae bacterium]|nr:SGNH/GDSL hydrolase family protein [Lacipirellulaceae bacterium]